MMNLKNLTPQTAQQIAQAMGRRLYGLAYRILGNRQAAEDAVQDVFLALLSGKARYDGRGSPEGFLLRVTSFIAIDRARQRKTRVTREAAVMQNSNPNPQQQPVLNAAMKEELSQEVAGLVDTLEPEARAALALRFWQGATLREIAAIMAKTKSSVDRLINKALNKLKAPLKRKGFGAAVALALLPDLLKGMETPPPSPGFMESITEAIKNAPATAPPADLPAIPQPAATGGLSLKTVSVSILSAAVITLALMGWMVWFPPGDPDNGNGHDLNPGKAPAVAGQKNQADPDTGPSDPIPQPGQGRIFLSGIVTNPEGLPAQNAQVAAFPGEGNTPLELYYTQMLESAPLARTQTDTSGRFIFRGLKPGTFRLIATTAKTAPGTSGLLRVKAGERLQSIPIRLQDGQTVEGIAKLESGEPVAGVQVHAILSIYIGQLSHGFHKVSVTSDAQGQFQIPGVGKHPAQLFAASDTHAVLSAPKYGRANGGPVEIILSKGCTLSGRVEDGQQQGIAEAKVLMFCRRNPGTGHARRYEPYYLVMEGATDADGRFTLSGLAHAPHFIRISKSGFVSPEPAGIDLSQADGPGEPLLLTMAAATGKTITGQCLRNDRPFGPATGAIVLYGPQLHGGREPDRPRLTQSRFYPNDLDDMLNMTFFPVDEKGRFETPPLPEGEYLLLAFQDRNELYAKMATSFQTAETPKVTTYRPGQKDIRIELPGRPATATLSGCVKTDNGRAVANAQVRAQFSNDSGNRTGTNVYTDQNGHFLLKPIFPTALFDRCDFEATTPDGRVGKLKNVKRLPGKGQDAIEIIIETGLGIAGRVLTPAGKPVAQAKVILTQDGHDPFPRAKERNTETDAKGGFTFGSLDDDRTYKVTVKARDWATAVVGELSVGDAAIRCVLVPEAIIQGRVVDLDGRPAAISSLSLTRYNNTRSSSMGLDYKTNTHGPGSFTVHGLAAGEYSLTAFGQPTRSGQRPVSLESDRIIIEEGRTVTDVTIVMSRLVALTGRVVDADTGKPIPNAIVADWDPDDHTFPESRRKVTADGEGRFRMADLPRGSTRIYGAAPGYMKQDQRVTITGKADAEAVISLSPAQVLTIKVLDENGKPVPNARVLSMLVWPPDHNVQTDETGTATIPFTTQGFEEAKKQQRNRVQVQYQGFSEAKADITDAIIREGRLTISLSAGGTVVGRVVDHKGQPVDRMTVHAYKDNRGIGSYTNASGRYKIGSLAPGEYQVRLSSRDRPMPTLAAAVTVEKGREAQADFRIPDPADFSLFPIRILTLFEDGTPAPSVALHLFHAWRKRDGKRQTIQLLPYYRNQHELKTDDQGVLEILFEEDDVDGIEFSGSFTRDGDYYQLKSGAGAVENGDIKAVYQRQPGGTVVLKVLDDATGDPVTGYKYMCRNNKSGTGGRCHQMNGVSRKRVRPGEITITVESEGYREGRKTIRLSDREEKAVTVRLTKQ